MRSHWVPLVAGVEWHAGHRGFERPAVVLIAGKRLEVTVDASWRVGPAEAGLPERRVFIVRDGGGQRLRIRVDPEGHSRVEQEAVG